MHETWSTNSLTLRGQKEGGLGGLLACEINALDFRLNVFPWESLVSDKL